MSQPIRAGDFRVCGYCGSRNKSAHTYCVRCAAPLDATVAGVPRVAADTGTRNSRLMRFLLAGGVLAAIGAGLMVRSMLNAPMDAVSDDVRADSARTVDATVAPPPPVSGWVPGANVPVETETAPPAWSPSTFPTARVNPYDVPGDPNASMVGIAPSAPRARAAVNRRRVYTEQDLLATRGGAWTPPEPGDVAERQAKLGVAESRVAAAQARLSQAHEQRNAADPDHVRKAIAQAEDDLEEAREDAARAQRKLQEARREN